MLQVQPQEATRSRPLPVAEVVLALDHAMFHFLEPKPQLLPFKEVQLLTFNGQEIIMQEVLFDLHGHPLLDQMFMLILMLAFRKSTATRSEDADLMTLVHPTEETLAPLMEAQDLAKQPLMSLST
jgi:hypothetical protein